eukprot:s808_g8.t1
MRKASVSEKEAVDGVLEHLVVAEMTSEVGVASEKSSKLKVSVPQEDKNLDKSPAKSKVSIFKRVLEKKVSDASSPAKSVKEQAAALSFVPHSTNPLAMSSRGGVTASQQELQAPPAMSVNGGVTVSHQDVGTIDLEADEAEALKQWLLQKAEVKAKTKKKKKGQKASPNKPALKKPAAVQPKVSEKKKEKDSAVKSLKTKEPCKVPFKKRKCDAAYHSAKNRAKKDGKSLEEACEAGSAAAAKMAADIDAGLVKDPDT